MTDRPIIFSAPMVRALLEGRKTMTRRIAWKPLRLIGEGGFGRVGLLQDPSPWQRVQPGDRLWVRENWQSDVRNVGHPPRDVPRTEPVWFAAGGDPINSPGAFAIQATGWRPSIHMPRWASRITLTVTAVRVERLQEISTDDALAEGCGLRDGMHHLALRIAEFRDLWNSLHGPSAWDANPEVVALTFTVAKENIDHGR